MIETAVSLYKFFIPQKGLTTVLDLGCGDGFFIDALLNDHRPTHAVLVDGSAEMLTAARQRLASRTARIDFIKASFQELLDHNPLTNAFDFIFSSLAIHHLNTEEKAALYSFIYDRLGLGGLFINFDVMLSPTANLEECYLSLWADWIKEHSNPEKIDQLLPIPEQYKDNPDNLPDTLSSQIKVLEEIGFQEVGCYLKFGIFSMFGGRKIQAPDPDISSRINKRDTLHEDSHLSS
ncbi:MAG: class I SAM-dependent methyltransferase [Desulfobulbaceae bacterium]|nr:class I SAM-dependent methyltransferase [Desulfobulbaceae bacterium]